MNVHSYEDSHGSPAVIMFGGGIVEDGKWTTYNDVHILDGTTMKWAEVTTSGTPPSPRRCACSWMVDRCLYIWGGRYEEETPNSSTFPEWQAVLKDYNDLFKFNTETKEWTSVPQTSPPMPRRSATCWKCETTKDGTWLFLMGGEFTQLGREQLMELATIHRCKITPDKMVWESGAIVMCHTFSAAEGLKVSNSFANFQMFSSSSICDTGNGFPRLYMFGGMMYNGLPNQNVIMLDFCFSTPEGIELLPLANCRSTVIHLNAQEQDPGQRAFGTAASGLIVTGYQTEDDDLEYTPFQQQQHDKLTNMIYRFTGVNWPRNIFTASGNKAYLENPRPLIHWQLINGLDVGERNGSGSVYVGGKLLVIAGGVYNQFYYGDTWVAEVEEHAEARVEWPDHEMRSEKEKEEEVPLATGTATITLSCNDGRTVETPLPVLSTCEYFKTLFSSTFADANNSVQSVPFPELLISFVVNNLLHAGSSSSSSLTAFLGSILEVQGTLGILLNPVFADAMYNIFACAEYFGVPENAWTRLEDEALSLLKHLYHAAVNTPGGTGFNEALLKCKEVAANGGMKRLFVHVCYIMKVGNIGESDLNKSLLF